MTSAVFPIFCSQERLHRQTDRRTAGQTGTQTDGHLYKNNMLLPYGGPWGREQKKTSQMIFRIFYQMVSVVNEHDKKLMPHSHDVAIKKLSF